MKKLKKILSAVCAAALSLNFAVFPASAAEKKDNGSLLVLGDSIATGFRLIGYKSGDNASAPDSFYNLLAPDFKTSLNLAADGMTTAQLLEKVKTDKQLIKSAKSADKIVISIGGNDFLQPMINSISNSKGLTDKEKEQIKNGDITMGEALANALDRAYNSAIKAAESADLEKSKKNISSILKKLTSYNKNAQIYILTVYDPFEGVKNMGDISKTSDKLLKKLNKGITSAAEKYENVHVVDVHAAFKGHAAEYTNILTADIHPSKKGHKKIFDKLLKEFRKDPSYKHIEQPETQTSSSSGTVTGNSAIDELISRYGGLLGLKA